MFHLNTELLIDYWRARRGGRRLPMRRDIDPLDFVGLLSQIFVAEQDAAADYRFRLAGEAVNDMHSRSLAGERLISLWRPADQWPLIRALDAALRCAEPVVIGAEARLDGAQVGRLEILFAPLTGPTGRDDRLLGLYQPLLGGAFAPAQELTIRSLDGVHGRPAPPPLRLAALDGRQIA